MNTAKTRDVWLVVLLAGVLLGFGFSQSSTERSGTQPSSYAIAFSSGPELRLLAKQDQVPAQGQTLICDQVFRIATTHIGRNCSPTIKGLAAAVRQ